jgi:hypothetical protein
MFDELRVRARKSRLVRNTYGKLRWFSSPEGFSEINQKIKHIGWSVQCPFCGWQGNEFYAHPEPHPRPNCLCPNCYSKERHRLLNLYLDAIDTFSSKPINMLDIAPGPYSKYWEREIWMANGQYLSLDLESKLALVRGDIIYLPFADRLFDIVICYHVLEHVPYDMEAMQELRRILKPGGRLFVDVPILRDITDEDLNVTDPKERLLRFGQDDHVRQYGNDFYDRLAKAGYNVNCIDFSDRLPSQIIKRFGLSKGMIINECEPVQS